MGPSGWVSGWILWPLERQGTVTIHSFTFTLCNRGRPFGLSAQHLALLPSRRPLSRAARGVTDRPTVFFRPGVRRVRVPTDRLPRWVALPRPCPPARALHPSLSRSIANRPERESRSACSTRPLLLARADEATVGAALAAALAPYQAPATATAVTCRGTATSTVGAALAAALAPYHVREV